MRKIAVYGFRICDAVRIRMFNLVKSNVKSPIYKFVSLFDWYFSLDRTSENRSNIAENLLDAQTVKKFYIFFCFIKKFFMGSVHILAGIRLAGC